MSGLTATRFEHGITAIDTHYVRPQLDASHLLVERGHAAFVDTGTNHSVPYLLETLAAADLDPADVDYVFLTHVHLDHAGGAGLLLQSLPNARVVVHPHGAPHMISPARLVAGSEAVYGEAAFRELYGDILPIPAERIVEAGDGSDYDLAGRRLHCFFTEGHARHHYCLHDPGAAAVFTGDSFGVSYRDFDTAKGPFIFPTTTPIHFDPPEAHRSVDRIMALAPGHLFLTHYSRVDALPRLADDMHRSLDAFADIARRHAAADERTARIRQDMFGWLRGRLRAHGVLDDDARLHELLDMDTALNTMGLEHWLENGNRH